MHIRLIPTNAVTVGMTIAERIHANDEQNMNVIVIRSGTILTEKMVELLRRQQIKEVRIFSQEPYASEPSQESGARRENKPPQESGAPQEKKPPQESRIPQVNKIPQTIGTIPPVEPIILDESLRVEAVDGIRGLFAAINEGSQKGNMTTAYQAVKGLETVVDHLVDSLISRGNRLVHIADLKSYDEYTYHHSLSVAVLSIAIGQDLGFDRPQLEELAHCAIMHDIGKTTLPLEIINKPSKLTDEEFAQVKDHPLNGSHYLQLGRIGNRKIWSGVAHHHEKVNGYGYPKGLAGEQIPLFSRIIAVADVYDAITSYRPYRSPMSPAEASAFIMSEIGKSFDYDIVKAFFNKLMLYPLNSLVELDNKRQGIVIDNTITTRPILKMLDNGEELDLANIDYLHLLIRRVYDVG